MGVSLCRVWKVIYCCMFHISLALLHMLLNKCHYVVEWVEEEKHKILERNTQQKGPVGTWFLEKHSARMRTGFGWLSVAASGGLFKAQHNAGAHIFSKTSGSHQKMLDACMLKCSRFNAEGPQASGVTV